MKYNILSEKAGQDLAQEDLDITPLQTKTLSLPLLPLKST